MVAVVMMKGFGSHWKGKLPIHYEKYESTSWRSLSSPSRAEAHKYSPGRILMQKIRPPPTEVE